MIGKITYLGAILMGEQNSHFWFSVRYFVLISILIYFLWIFSRYITKKNYISLKERNIKVIDRIALSNDKFLLLVELENIFYFMAMDKNGFYLLDKRNDLDLENYLKDNKDIQINFVEQLKSSIEKRKNGNDKNQTND